MKHVAGHRRALLISLALGLLCAAPFVHAAAPPKIETFTAGMKHEDGFLPVYWDDAGGRVYLEVPGSGTQALFFTTIAQSIGSNDIGIDRGQISRTKLVRFDRVGAKVLMTQLNAGFRAVTDDEPEQLAVEQSFASSVLYGFTVAASSGERLLVDATDFVLQDHHGVIAALKRSSQGDFKLDPSRSAISLAGTKAFARNSELEGTITLAAVGAPGPYVKDVVPTPEALTIKERYSFFALPEPGFKPRYSMPGDGYSGWDYDDYATPLGEPLVRHLIARHRLQKKDPSAAVSDAVKPIVYYIDPGAPPLIRQALLEGARWWSQAFEAAGYRNAFKVEMLPEGADPLDGRYNIIQWVHRATRGWSYGYGVIDPRTGEIIKGNVTLGSLRARYDYLIAEGLLSPYSDPQHVPDAMQEMALARLRQLAAHELGHTLGLSHNHLGSSEGRSSVMDYPGPLVKLDGHGGIDLSDAYATGIGEWDKVSIAYGYQDFPAGTDETAALRKILADARARGLHFLADQDARPDNTAHPLANQWDNGTDAAAELRRAMQVRRVALQRFDENAIRVGQPMATIEEALVPLYLYHRYQAKAAATALGGQLYSYAVRGDGQLPTQPVPAAQQRDALAALLETLAPAQLTLSPQLLAQLPPRPLGYDFHRELFARHTGITFDALGPATAASELTIGLLLNGDRAARLVEQQALDARQPGFAQVLDAIDHTVFGSRAANGYERQVLFVEQTVFVQQLMRLAGDAMAQVRGHAGVELVALRERLAAARGGDDAERAQRYSLLDMMARFERRTPTDQADALPTIPPGPPL
ncbi:MAG: zinc-dependent metalloprotease [Solimonas sp.]